MSNSITLRSGKASVKLVSLDPGVWALSNLFSRHRGQGHATAVMKKVIAYADKNGLEIKLLVQRYGHTDRKALDNLQLIAFYEKFGFQRIGEGRPIMMVRYASQRVSTR